MAGGAGVPGADLKAAGASGPKRLPTKAMVSEAGASVYSASAYAAHELPELDVTLRGAVSIARRLQDPLAELVKIEPKSIGVGQYQHDVDQGKLGRSLDGVVEDAVNAVGVDLNTAADWIKAGAVAIGVGSSLVKKELINGGKWDELSALAKQYVDVVAAARA